MDRDPEVAAAEKRLALLNPIRFFNLHAWTHEPRKGLLDMYGLSRPTLPFLLFPFQEEGVEKIVSCIREGRDVLIEKSRDMGVSWFIVTIFLWFWLQEQAGNDFLIGSRKEEYVDRKGNLDTLIEKIRYCLYRLHPVFLPEGFSTDRNDNYMRLTNPSTGSYIKGESNNSNFGTGGRYLAILADEFSKWLESDSEAWTSMGDSSPCRIPVSTPWGIGRKFAQLRFSGAIEVVTMHWSLHPLKSIGLYEKEGKKRSIYYDLECQRRSDNERANIGQELDIDYLSSGTPYFDNILLQKRYDVLTKQSARGQRYEFEVLGGSPRKIRLIPAAAGRIVILEEPVEYKNHHHRYLISSDVAEGLEKGDNSNLFVYDRITGKDVAWFSGKVDTDTLSYLLNFFGRKYQEAFIGVERNNHGHAVVGKLKDFYPWLMYEQEFRENIDYSTVRLGWLTDAVSRPIMLSNLREVVKDGKEGVGDEKFYLEGMTFIYNKNGKPEADEGNLDDRVMSQAIKFELHRWLPAPRKIERKVKDYGYTDYGETSWRSKIRVLRPEGAAGV